MIIDFLNVHAFHISSRQFHSKSYNVHLDAITSVVESHVIQVLPKSSGTCNGKSSKSQVLQIPRKIHVHVIIFSLDLMWSMFLLLVLLCFVK